MSYTWNVPTKVLFGPGSVKKLAKQKLPGKKALLLTSNGKSAKQNGSLDSVTESLETAGITYVLFDRIPANPTEPVVMEGAVCARENSCDFVIGLGGGSVLDAATVIAAMAPQKEGTVWDYIRGGSGRGRRLQERPLPYLAITTSAGTGSEVDCWGVVTKPETHEKIGFKGSYPALAIVDPELMLTVPPAYTAYQGFDALFHNVEGYLSRFANEFSEMIELQAIRDIAVYLPKAVADGSDLEARTKVAFANTLGGYSMEVCTCVSEHAIEHAMSGYHENLPHGAGLIMISEAYFTKMIELDVEPERFVTLAKALGKEDAEKPLDFIEALHALKEACGVADLRMSSYGITPEEFAVLAVDARATMGSLFACDREPLMDVDVIDVLQRSYR